MPPKTKFDKETVVEAALEIAKEKGLSGITARSVATKLKASVAPIYVNFSTIEELVETVVHRVFAMTDELLEEQQGSNVFENIGRASLAFARMYPALYREMTIEPNPYMASYDTVEQAMIEAMGEDEHLKEWSLEERKRLLLKMRVFQMGLTTMVVSGHVPSWVAEGELEEILMEVGEELMKVKNES
ncbi:TetR/AcrR family transcriptional regulator [Anoxynatronum buryatiense]|uniref:Transcriptional regulator, TetR family n=1 Tax=Anoxynatronum buryatiense TaxID=489973 RepID=A0AA45WYR4_9CLOT|nr:TetR/AcrR family transcriptional regulator [Anoxynatronum buryatiense]SMP69293.1 transcriptional regulator, TetR family [Anoxynatronum buryatiense]